MNERAPGPITPADLQQSRDPADDPYMSSIGSVNSYQQAVAQQEVAYAVARKALDNTKAQGDAVIALLQSAADVQKTAQSQRPLAPGQTISLVA